MKCIETHEDLLKLHNRKVTCRIKREIILDGKIIVEGGNVFICQNVISGMRAHKKFGYKYSWVISRPEEFQKFSRDKKCYDCYGLKLTDGQLEFNF